MKYVLVIIGLLMNFAVMQAGRITIDNETTKWIRISFKERCSEKNCETIHWKPIDLKPGKTECFIENIDEFVDKIKKQNREVIIAENIIRIIDQKNK